MFVCIVFNHSKQPILLIFVRYRKPKIDSRKESAALKHVLCWRSATDAVVVLSAVSHLFRGFLFMLLDFSGVNYQKKQNENDYLKISHLKELTSMPTERK